MARCIVQDRKAGAYRVEVVAQPGGGARFTLQKCEARNPYGLAGLPGPCRDVASGMARSVGEAKTKGRALLRRRASQKLGPWRCLD